jgi:predicted component of type VI protein secretion system
MRKLITAILLLITLCAISIAQDKPMASNDSEKPKALTDTEKLKIRELQLAVSDISVQFLDAKEKLGQIQARFKSTKEALDSLIADTCPKDQYLEPRTLQCLTTPQQKADPNAADKHKADPPTPILPTNRKATQNRSSPNQSGGAH